MSESYSLEELKTLCKEDFEKKDPYKSEVPRKEQGIYSQYKRLIISYNKNFNEKLKTKPLGVFIGVFLISIFIIIQAIWIIFPSAKYFLFQVIPGPIANNLLYVLLPAILFCSGPILEFFIVKKQKINEFNLKYLIFTLLIASGLFWLISLSLVALNFGAILGLYLFQLRILGAGEAHFAGVKLLTAFGEQEKKFDQYIMRDSKAFLKGIEDWCTELLRVRIDNIDEFRTQLLSKLATHYEETINKLQTYFNGDFFKKLENYKNTKNLSVILESLENIFEFKLRFKLENTSHKISRNLGKLGLFSTLISFLGSLYGFIVIFL